MPDSSRQIAGEDLKNDMRGFEDAKGDHKKSQTSFFRIELKGIFSRQQYIFSACECAASYQGHPLSWFRSSKAMITKYCFGKGAAILVPFSVQMMVFAWTTFFERSGPNAFSNLAVIASRKGLSFNH